MYYVYVYGMWPELWNFHFTNAISLLSKSQINDYVIMSVFKAYAWQEPYNSLIFQLKKKICFQGKLESGQVCVYVWHIYD